MHMISYGQKYNYKNNYFQTHEGICQDWFDSVSFDDEDGQENNTESAFKCLRGYSEILWYKSLYM